MKTTPSALQLPLSVSVTPLSDEQARTLCSRFGFSALRPHQSAAIATMAAGIDLLLMVSTGGGKTEAMLGAKLLHPESGLHVQIEPLRALQADMRDRMEKLGLRVAVLNSDLSPSLYAESLQQIKQGQVDCVLTTPEQLTKKKVFKALNEIGVGYLVVDEAHCLLDYGGDFRPAYDKIGTFISHLDNRPVVAACTATLAPDGIKKVKKSLGMLSPAVYRSSVDRPEIRQRIIEVGTDLTRRDRDLLEKERIRRLKRALKEHVGKGDGVIVYCNTVAQTIDIAKQLLKAGHCAEAFYADLPAKKKEDIRHRFRSSNAPIIVATSAFGMGMDKPNVRLIVHMSLPLSVEDYWQKTGRAGRDGKKSFSYLFWAQADYTANQYILGSDRVKRKKLTQLLDLVRTKRCYEQQLRAYFGEKEGKPCGRCSFCKQRK